MSHRLDVDELPFMRALLLALGSVSWCRVWRQNVGEVLVRDERGTPLRVFRAGPPNGVADISGFVRPEGWRLEIETKADGGRDRLAQKRFARVATLGGAVYVRVEYDEALDLDTNVARAVARVKRAIAARRRRAA